MKRLFLILLICTLNTCFGQTGTVRFCDVHTQIRDATSIAQIDNIIIIHFKNVLGNKKVDMATIGINPVDIKSPIGQRDADAILYEARKRIFFKFQSSVTNVVAPKWFQRDLSEAKIVANEILNLFDNVCEIVQEKDPIVRYIKIFDKILELGESSTGHLGFIVKLTRTYLDVTIKAIKYIDYLSRYTAHLYLNNELPINIRFAIDESRYSDWLYLGEFIKVTKFEVVTEDGLYIQQVDVKLGDNSSSSFDARSVTIQTPALTRTDVRYFLRMTIGDIENVVYLPINEKLASSVAGGGAILQFKFRIKEGKKNNPKSWVLELL